MKRSLSLALLLFAGPATAAELPKPLAEGMVKPESVAVAPGGKIYVSVIGGDKDGDGSIAVIENGKPATFVGGLDDPKGIAIYQKWLYVADKTKVLRIDTTAKQPKADVYAAAEKFPVPPLFLNDVAVDPESGAVFVTDSGDRKGSGGAVFRLTPPPMPKGKVDPAAPKGELKIDVVVDTKTLPALKMPNGVTLDGQSHLILADMMAGVLYRVKLADRSTSPIADGLAGADGLTWDHYGRLFVSSWNAGKLFVIPKPGDKPVLVAEGFGNAADTCLDATGKNILVPDMKNGTLTAIPAQVPAAPVDDTPLSLKTEVAFGELKWAGWKDGSDGSKVVPLRPIVLTHAGDGSNRVFVATQQGVVHVFANDQKATETKVFLDIQDRVKYKDNENEEGFLGLAFHPKFKENGEVFVFYTPKKEDKVNVVSRFRLSKTDPTKLDPASEEQLVRFENKLWWNHDGGTVCFGPDGFLYVIHGDGGQGGDPKENGQNLGVLYGKILRIDVDKKDEGKNYAVPKDNPFVGKSGALPEIWAYGIRNIWRMSFDKKTGKLWAGEVGQNLYEEINIIEKGGNYGWNKRESFHPFGPKGVGQNKDMVDPIWEYHHDIGKSITGGHVYRGKALPELDGHYLYADYVSSKIWALKYDDAAKRVTANRPIKDPAKPVLSFGEAEDGEVYFLTVTNTGKGIYRFAK